MTVHTRRFLALIGVVLLPAAVLGPSVAWAQASWATFSFDLDVPAGRFSEWRLEDLGPVTGVSGVIRFTELRPGGHGGSWVPTFGIGLKGADTSLVLRISSKNGKAPVFPKIELWAHDSLVTTVQLLGAFEVNDSIDFSLSWTEEGEATVRVGSAPPRVAHIGPRRFWIGVSSAEVKASRLEFHTKAGT